LENGASVVTRGSVAKGLLTNEWQKRLANTNGYVAYSQQELKDTLSKLSQATPSLHAASLKTILNHNSIASAVVGASSKEQLATTIHAYEEMDSIKNLEDIIHLTKQAIYTSHRD
jgi:aryl-alcohol dehydrogenase-like predicted oxidoreductase